MHLLATTSGIIDGAPEAIDLNQSPADIIVLSAADSELAALARAHETSGVSLRLANLLHLQHNLSVDLYIEKTLSTSKLIVLRLLGGASYWTYGLDQVEALARENGILLAALPGDAQPDPGLVSRSTLPLHHCERLHRYLVTGGLQNTQAFLAYCRHLTEGTPAPEVAKELPKAGVYADTSGKTRPLAAITFYRSVLEGGQTAPIDALVNALVERGIGTKAVYVASLKDAASAAALKEALQGHPPDIILNATSFAVASGGSDDPLADYDCPVLQVVLAGSSEETWRQSTQGLDARDLAMNVVLPELDGRILSRAVSFKADTLWHEPTQCRITTYREVPDRVAYVADLAANWVKLRRTPPRERKVAIVLANYPNKDGRIANGVGYDTPASTVAILAAMQAEGYTASDYPATGNGIIDHLQRGRQTHCVPPSRHGWARPSQLPREITGSSPVMTRPLLQRHAPARPGHLFHSTPTSAISPHYRNPYVSRSPNAGAIPRAIPSSPLAPSTFPSASMAMPPSPSSRLAATTSIRSRPTMIPPCCRRTAISPSISGSGIISAHTPSYTTASTAISNGCLAKQQPCRPNASPRSRWGHCRSSIPSLSTTPAKARRPSAAAPPSSSTISRPHLPGQRATVR